ncbi:MAG TPA: M20/M25/M40 family metallo-hydrolase [Bacteroidetes bacterium]|nr:M20/M25/M40 family metallo-hydrolase [Bacteroidota bacterium]
MNLNSIVIILLSSFTFTQIRVIVAADNNVIDRLKADVAYLSGPELAGRNVPGPYGDKTAHWVAGRFAEIGLTPAVGDSAFMQKVPLITGLLDTAETMIRYRSSQPQGKNITCLSSWGLENGQGFYIFPKRLAPMDTSCKALYCGHGIVSGDLERNDFRDVDGCAAVVSSGIGELTPREAGRFMFTPFKAAAADQAGAAMLVEVYPPLGKDMALPPRIQRKSGEVNLPLVDLPETAAGFPTVHLFTDMKAQDISGIDLKVVFKDMNQTRGFNVIAGLEGEIPEYIIVGAHYDHLGAVEGDEQNAYYHGADDNASGVAGLLEICRRWHERNRTGRGLIAVAFTAEEDGMLGSRWFVDHLPVPREAVTAMVNLDEIGRRGFANMRDVQKDIEPDPKYAGAYYSAASPKLRDILRSAVHRVDLNVELEPVNNFSHFGDAGPFHEAHIPTVQLFSGFHKDYHSPSDTIDKLDFEKMSSMVDLTSALLEVLTQAENAIEFNPGIRVEKPHIPH